MEFNIVEKEAFKVIGISKEIKGSEGYVECPKFWEEFTKKNFKSICGQYAVCLDNNGNESFTYVIADELLKEKRYEKDLKVFTIPKKTWVVFPCLGALPKSLQDVNNYIFTKWLKENGRYELDGNMSLEYYTDSTFFEKGINDPSYYSEIWLPVKEIAK